MKNFKNNKGIGLIPFILIFVGVLVIAGISVGGIIVNKKLNKEPLSAKAFQEKMEYKDFETENIINEFQDDDSIKKAYIALEEDYEYKIEFYKLDEEEDAISFYNLRRESAKDSEDKILLTKEKSMGNNSKYTLETKDKYKVVSRIENTVIYADVDLKYEDEVKEILKEMGY